MQEVLAKPGFEKQPLAEQEFYELRLDDVDDLGRLGFFVRWSHVQWSEIDQQMLWEGFPPERFSTLTQAKAWYESKRRELVEAGFSQSDMEL